MSIAIEARGLSKSYRKRNAPPVKAVDNVSLEVLKGQVFAFLGPNGAGKTTTIKMMCGLIAPDSGSAFLNGYDAQRQHYQAMNQIGVVLEGTRNVYWRLTAWENLMYFGRLKGFTGKRLAQRAEQFLRELDLWDRRNDLVNEFSRGMQQKVSIACALIHDPPIVLLDEPTLGLDVQASRTVKGWVAKLSREQGKTVVLTTHQLDMAEELCDRVAIMSKGRLVANQAVSELLGIFRQEYYQIKLKGHLNGNRPPWLSGLADSEENGETTLTGPVAGQDALHTLLDSLHGLGMPLLEARRVDPNLEEVFVRLTSEDGVTLPGAAQAQAAGNGVAGGRPQA
ncbi:MAG: ABC transporter ATP-binding protein [Chloroflexi bacterium]|nr:ABC transporter ATP-binding protein [Chloroflexota bacterium]MCL5275658.1 ABC transporter ATP-binding protein [Chloroflexota bacterium]